MGGGPVDSEIEEPQSLATTVPALDVQGGTATAAFVHEEAPASSFPAEAKFEENRLPQAAPPPVVNQTDQEKPILTSMAAGGVIGGIMGSVLGMGGMVGTTTGAFIGASMASRDDQMGAKVRQTALTLRMKAEEGFAMAVDRVNQEELGRDLTRKVSNALQTIVETGEKYKVVDKVESAAGKVYQTAEPKVQQLYEKIREADKNEYIPRVQSALFAIDQATGFTRSVEAVKRELKV